mmetsp:Transcript_18739/g.65047  ORF Transcript_18739/g.65047 Transcript_18739/m.65047 type:complete len:207 (-) Transcript_18739:2516-3136(-)
MSKRRGWKSSLSCVCVTQPSRQHQATRGSRSDTVPKRLSTETTMFSATDRTTVRPTFSYHDLVKPTYSPMKTCSQKKSVSPRSPRHVGSHFMLKTGTRSAVLRKMRKNVFHAVFTSCVEIESWRSTLANAAKSTWKSEFTATTTSTSARSIHLMPRCVAMCSRQTTWNRRFDRPRNFRAACVHAYRSISRSKWSRRCSLQRTSRSQ